MRVLVALALVAGMVAACGGGTSSPPIQVSPGVTAAPAQTAPASPKATDEYREGY